MEGWAIVFATLAAPFLAVQATMWLERRREARRRQAMIYQSLMITRRVPLSPERVRAFNSIPVEFYGHKEIIDAWKKCLDHALKSSDVPGWGEERVDLLVNLLLKIGTALNYRFDTVQLKNEIWAPIGHQLLEQDQEIICKGVAAVLSGQATFPLDIQEHRRRSCRCRASEGSAGPSRGMAQGRIVTIGSGRGSQEERIAREDLISLGGAPRRDEHDAQAES